MEWKQIKTNAGSVYYNGCQKQSWLFLKSALLYGENPAESRQIVTPKPDMADEQESIVLLF